MIYTGLCCSLQVLCINRFLINTASLFAYVKMLALDAENRD